MRFMKKNKEIYVLVSLLGLLSLFMDFFFFFPDFVLFLDFVFNGRLFRRVDLVRFIMLKRG